MDLRPWKTLSRDVLISRPPWLTVEDHEVELPDGQTISNWLWVVTPEYVSIAALTEKGEFVCLRQTKYSFEGISLAAPGGYLEPDESPLDGAKRELREETGYEAPKWIDLGSYAVEGNRGVGRGHFFLALDARLVSDVNKDDLEEQEILLLTKTDIRGALSNREFKLMSWATTFALALLHFGSDDGAQ